MLTTEPKRSCVHFAALLAVLGLPGCRRLVEPPPAPPAVRIAVANQVDGGRDLHLSGTIEAERSTALSFAVPGTVTEVLVQEGAQVSRGQPLARLDARAFRDALGIAQAKADQAEDVHRRLEPMHVNGTVPEVKWVEADAGLRQARLALSMAEKNAQDAVLRAPEAGVVARRNAEPGSSALSGVPAFILVQSRVVLATAPVPERQVGAVRVGQPASVPVAALGRTFEGTVREVGVSADPLTRTYPVKVAVANPDGALRVGMVAEVILRQEGASPSVAVPPEAVRLDEEGKPCVYVVAADGTLRRQPVEVSGYAGEQMALAHGVAPGERVVVSGTPMLAHGMRVTVVDGGAARD